MTVERLAQCLQTRVPNAQLCLTRLPQVPEIQLALLSEDYPQDQLSAEQAIALMDAPPYWCFCWASGQVLARKIMDSPSWVAGHLVVDFGAGSGVVAIAAKLAGAHQVVACDSDPIALQACRFNAKLNGVEIDTADSLDQLTDVLIDNHRQATVCVADVFYDRDNIPLLDRFLKQFDQVLIADSRLGGRELSGTCLISTVPSFTVPDLNESADFNSVSLYQGCGDNAG